MKICVFYSDKLFLDILIPNKAAKKDLYVLGVDLQFAVFNSISLNSIYFPVIPPRSQAQGG